MDFPRCDATVAWAALQGHFEAHGRALDLREAFARDPAASTPSRWRRPACLPTCRRTCGT